MIILYHGNCSDGFASAWIAKRALGDRAECYPCEYVAGGGDVIVPDVTGQDVVVHDFCFSPEQTERLHAQAKSFIVLDHHELASKKVAHLPYCHFNMSKSGARLALDHWFPETENWIVDYVEDRDLWRHALPGTHEINAAIGLLPFDFAAWDEALAVGKDEYMSIGRGVSIARKSYVDRMVHNARPVTIQGHVVKIINCLPWCASEMMVSMIGDHPFSVSWFMQPDGTFKYGLRSSNGFNVSEVAAVYGGGGHPAASGFVSKSAPWELWNDLRN